MHSFMLISLFSYCVPALIISPVISPAPRLAEREAAENVCGYYSLNGLINTVSCSIGTPCLVATNLSPAVGYCSGVVNVPVTTIYQYANWPAGGCGPGSACCPLLTPDVGKYLFNDGATVFLGCGMAPFTYTAFFSDAGFAASSTPAAAQSPAAATAKTTSVPGSTSNHATGMTTSPNSVNPTNQASPVPSQTSTSSGFSSKTTTTIIVVGAATALVGGLVFLWFLYLAWKVPWKVHQAHKYPNPQYSLLPHDSQASLQSGTPVKKSGLSKWSKIATVISPIFAIAGLAVAIYFGLKQNQ